MAVMGRQRLLKTIEILCPAGSSAAAEDFVSDFFQSIPLFKACLFHFVFWLFWCLPPVILFRFCVLGNLSAAEQQRYLNWWEYNRFQFIREISMILKSLALLARVGREWEPA